MATDAVSSVADAAVVDWSAAVSAGSVAVEDDPPHAAMLTARPAARRRLSTFFFMVFPPWNV